MKLTPFVLFCILLLVLVISSLFGKKFIQSLSRTEGFQEGMASLTSTIVPEYSSHNVFNLNDNIYYDSTNANIVEITTATTVSSVDSGNTVTMKQSYTVVTPRDGQNSPSYTNQYKTSPEQTNVPSSQTATISNSYSSFVYPSQSKDKNYNVFYMPWGVDTYIHVIDSKLNTNLATFGFMNGGATNNYSYPTDTKVGLEKYSYDSDPANMSMVSEPIYSTTRSVYQLSHFVKYDIMNGNILLQSGDGASKTFTVYDINNKSTVLSKENQISLSNNKTSLKATSAFQPFTILDTNGQNLVLCIPTQQKVLVALISFYDSTKKSYNISVCRFTANGLDTGDQNGDWQSSGYGKGNGFYTGNPMSEYYRWYNYWNSVGMPGQGTGQGTGQGKGFPGSDYILKTQIVPPVCPTCPACPSNSGTCTNCGGQGGSGTQVKGSGTTGTSGSGENVSNIGSGTFSSNANPDTIGGSLTLATYDTVAGAEDIAKTAGGTVLGVANAIGNTGSNIVGAGKDAVVGVASAGANAIGSLGQGTGQGTNLNNNEYDSNGKKINQRSIVGPGTQNNYNGANDTYSYYGQLPARGKADFMPLTTDFSRFGR
uniref:Uncharacterized protein n=1 Tax=viral metagenome TaxID=1070528 RepID=A0A6C0JKB0_9ZZZZ